MSSRSEIGRPGVPKLITDRSSGALLGTLYPPQTDLIKLRRGRAVKVKLLVERFVEPVNREPIREIAERLSVVSSYDFMLLYLVYGSIPGPGVITSSPLLIQIGPVSDRTARCFLPVVMSGRG